MTLTLLALVGLALPWLRATGARVRRPLARRLPLRVRRGATLLAASAGLAVLGAARADAATLVVDGPPHGDVLDPVVLTPDGSRILFLADLDVDHKVELWSAPAFGGAPTRVTPALGPDADVIAFALTPDGRDVVYLADQATNDVIELFRAPVGGGGSSRLSQPLAAGQNVLRFGVTPDGDRVVFLADADVDNTYELYSVRLAGGAPTRLTPDLPPWADVDFSFLLTGDSQRAVFRADVGDDQAYDLFSVLLDGSEEPWRLSADVISESGVLPDLVTNADVSAVSFRMEVDRGVFHRFAVPADGSADATLVHPDLPEEASGATEVAALSSDGRGIVFVADLETPGLPEVWLAPSNGTAEPRRLSGRMAEEGRVLDVQLTSDSLTAVYLAEQRAAGVAELFAAALDEPTPARRISRSLASGGDVLEGFVIVPGDQQVVYRADARRNGQVELFVSEIGGRATSRVLSGELPEDGDVASVDEVALPSFHVSWDGSEVLFLADAETDGDVDLHTVPTDGSEEPVRLNDHVAGRSVEDMTALVASRVGFVTVDSQGQSDEDVYLSPVRSPPAPTNPQAVFGPDSATVSWDAPITDVPVGGYVITAQPGGVVTIVDGDTTETVVEGLDDGVTYTFTIEAVNDLGASPGVTTDPGTTIAAPPDPVADMTVEAGPNALTVSWTPASSGERVEGYTLRAEPGDDTLDLPPSVTEVTVDGLDPDTAYTFFLVASNGAGVSRTGAIGPVRPLRADGSPSDLPPLPEPVFRVLADDDVRTISAAEVDRLAGSSRYATAATLSKAAFPEGAELVYLATGRNFPDALAAGPVAAQDDAPILLTEPDALPADTVTELQRLGPAEIRILGGPGAVSTTVEQALAAVVSGATVSRVAGPDRYATAAALSQRGFAPGVAEVWLATGRNFPDALAAGAVAGARGTPILLTEGATLPAATAAELNRLKPGRVLVLGGPAAIDDGVLAAVQDVVGAAIEVRRVAGANRYETATAVTREAFAGGVEQVLVAVGTNFPDALAAGPMAVRTSAPILLTAKDELPSATRAELLRLAPRKVTILGGTAAVSLEVLLQVADLVDATPAVDPG